MDGEVSGLASYQNNLFVTGSFSNAGLWTTTNMAKWNGSSWYFVVSGSPAGINGDGSCLTPFNGDLFVGGFFAVAGNLTGANSIVRYNFPVGIEEEYINSSNIKVHPNPSSGKFQLQLTGSIPEKFDLHVTDVSGRDLYFREIDNYTLNTQIDLAPLKSGMYFLKLVNENSVTSTKIIIE